MDNDTEGVFIQMEPRRGGKDSLEFKGCRFDGREGISDLLQGYRIGFGISEYNSIISVYFASTRISCMRPFIGYAHTQN